MAERERFAKGPGEEKGDTVGAGAGPRLIFKFDEARQPGVYEFVLNRKDIDPTKPDAPKGAEPEKAKQETVAYAFNIDALSESDLRRASQDGLDSVTPNVPLHTPDDQTYHANLA